jgi:UDP-N-acetyl-D-mannosaminuronic acid dehydrogenase
LANRHPRVNILQLGAGVGGHCVAVDTWFNVARDPENSKVIRAAREVNTRKTWWVIEQIKSAVVNAAKLSCIAKIACLGLAFKTDIDDLRYSPAVHIAQALLDQDYDLVAVEPNIQKDDRFTLVKFEEALESADILLLWSITDS